MLHRETFFRLQSTTYLDTLYINISLLQWHVLMQWHVDTESACSNHSTTHPLHRYWVAVDTHIDSTHPLTQVIYIPSYIFRIRLSYFDMEEQIHPEGWSTLLHVFLLLMRSSVNHDIPSFPLTQWEHWSSAVTECKDRGKEDFLWRLFSPPSLTTHTHINMHSSTKWLAGCVSSALTVARCTVWTHTSEILLPIIWIN